MLNLLLCMFPLQTVTAGGADEEDDAKLTQTDYNKAMGNKDHDPIYVSFLTRIARPGCTGQVLRYCRWATTVDDSEVVGTSRVPSNLANGALLISGTSDTKHKWESVPPCQRCGARRAFEFQVGKETSIHHQDHYYDHYYNHSITFTITRLLLFIIALMPTTPTQQTFE